MKIDLPPHSNAANSPSCALPVAFDDNNLLNETNILVSQTLVTTDGGSLNHKVIYITGFLSRKYKINDAGESISLDFLYSLNGGGYQYLRLPSFCTQLRKFMIDYPLQRNIVKDIL